LTESPTERPAVTPRPPGAESVLSFDQQRLWLESKLRPTAAYHLHGRYWLRGTLDVAVLERCIRKIIGRHEILRTTFPFVDGRPVQRVAAPDPHWRITVADVGATDDRVARAEQLADRQAAEPFDLERGPLLRCLLVPLGDAEHLLSITMHHIVSDAWSIGLFLRELSALYRVDGDEACADLPALPIQYLDYAVWQRNRLTGDRLAPHVDYWRERLAGAAPALALPTARRRSPAQGAVGGRVHTAVDAADTAALHELCRRQRVTPFIAVLAALATVLRRWSGQDDVVIGVPVSTRRDTGTDRLIGVFLNTLPLRVELAGDPPFAEVLGRVRQAFLDGYDRHGETPFDVLVSELRAVRDPSRTPLVQVALNMVDQVGGSEDQWQLPGISVQPVEPPLQPGQFDLNVYAGHRDGALHLQLLYHADRYDPPSMQALLDQMGALLAAVAADPTRGILRYELARPVAAPPALHHRLDVGGDDRIAVAGGGPELLQIARCTAVSAGATLVVPDDTTVEDPERLVRWLSGASVSVLYAPAPRLRALPVRDVEPVLPMLRCALLDNWGELTAHDVRRVRQLAPACRVVGLYRATPTGEPLAAYRVPDAWAPSTAPLRVPIGTEVADPAVVRNPAGRPAASGEAGELCAGSFRTGDFARRRTDGVLEFAAPYDDPLETVAALRDLPDVRDAVVTEHRGPDGRTALAAYVANPDGPVDLDRLHQHLVTQLPPYLVPNPVLVLDRLPLTSYGDYDLAALPALDAGS
jgi:hypothetical protein